MVRLRDFNLAWFGAFKPMMFDLATDPGEQNNIFDSAEPIVTAARETLQKAAQHDLDFGQLPKRRSENTERLRDLFAWDTSAFLTNQYTIPSGLVVDADSPIYPPAVVRWAGDGTILDFPPVKRHQ